MPEALAAAAEAVVQPRVKTAKITHMNERAVSAREARFLLDADA